MGKVFMTVVGKGNYSECTYVLNGRESRNCYIQKALMEILLGQGMTFDKIVCFMTKESRERNWEKSTSADRQGNASEGEGLLPFFRERLPHAAIIPQIIPFAKSEQEILNTFQIMYDSLAEGDEVTLDVTHGFRFMPMLFLPVLSYAGELKNVKTDAIYYGAFESQEEKKPVINLITYQNILSWSNAAHSFVRHGSSEEISDMADEMNRQAYREGKGQMYTQVKRVANALNDFTGTIQTSRGSDFGDGCTACKDVQGEGKAEGKKPGRQLYKRSVSYAYRKVREEYGKLADEPVFLPLNNLLDHAVRSIGGFEGKDIVGTGVETIRWCIGKGMVQQGYTALEETLITHCCLMLGHGDYVRKETREAVGRAITAFRGALSGEAAERRREEILRETPGRDGDDLVFRDAVEKLSLKIIRLSNNVKDKRNDINHFGMRDGPMTADQLKQSLKEDFEEFLSIAGDSAGGGK